MTGAKRLFSQEELDALCVPAAARIGAALDSGDTKGARAVYAMLEEALRNFSNLYVGWTASMHEFLSQRFGHEADAAASRPEGWVTVALRVGLTADEVRIAAEVFGGPGSPTARRMEELINAGDMTGAKQFWATVEAACRRLHDFRRDWMTEVLAHVYRTHGPEVLEQCLRYSGNTDWWEKYMLADIEKDPKDRVHDWALMLVVGNFGTLRITEHEERFILTQDPCGSCGRQHRDCRYEPPWNFPLIKEKLPLNFFNDQLTIYRTHLAVMHTIMPVEKIGAPWPAFECPGTKGAPCQLYVYKNPRTAAQRFYTMVGKNPPSL